MNEEQELLAYMRANWFKGHSGKYQEHILEILRAKDAKIGIQLAEIDTIENQLDAAQWELEANREGHAKVIDLALVRLNTIKQMASEIVRLRDVARLLFIFIEEHAGRNFLAHARTLKSFHERLLEITNIIDLDPDALAEVSPLAAALKRDGKIGGDL